jgi:Uma2 family endonuclease
VLPDDDLNYRVPDLAVSCVPSREHWVEEPRLVVEILSKSTRKYDMTGKLAFYRSIPSIDEILLVRFDERWCELWQRVSENWSIKDYIGSSELPLRIATTPMPLDEIYAPLEL